MRRALAVGLGIALASLACAPAEAAPPVDHLLVYGGCGSDGAMVAIVPDPSLSREIRTIGAVGGLTDDGGTARVTTACGGDALTIRVPPSFPVQIEAAKGSSFRLGNLDGPVVAHLDGGAELTAGSLAGGLVLENDGGGDVQLGSLAGPSSLSVSGSGDLSIGHVDAASLAIALSGSGDGNIGGGRIGTLQAAVSGSGDLDIEATVGGGSASTSGSGDVSIGRVTGTLVENRGGSGDISVRDDAPGAGRTIVGVGNTPISVPPVAIAPIPPMPAMPPIPPMPAMSGVGTTSARSGGSGVNSSVDGAYSDSTAELVAALSVAAGATLLVLRARRRRVTTVSATADPRIRAAADRLDAIARRVGRVEALVTSREFDLHRRFREMGD